MKIQFLIISTLSLLLALNVSADDIDLDADISKVTVFRNGAQIQRTGWVTIPKGSSQVLIKGVSPQINASSIQAGGEGDFTILSAQYKLVYEQPGKQPEVKVPTSVTRAITRIQDSITWLDFEVRGMKDQQNVLKKEKELLLNDRSITEGSDTITELPVILDFFRKRMNNINAEWLKLERKLSDMAKLRQDLNRRLQEYIAYRNQIQTPPRQGATPVHQIMVNIASDKVVKGRIRVEYLVNGAGWTPSYEIKGGSAIDKVNFVYKGSVYQNTGVPWNNVRITLSNMNPNRSQHKPVLQPWFLNYFVRKQTYSGSVSNTLQVVEEATVVKMNDDEDLDFAGGYVGDTFVSNALTGANFTNVNTNFSNVEFEVKLRYTIPSDGQQQIITVGKHELPSVFIHSAVPKLDNESFILAKLTGWESLNLLPGMANIYLGGTLVGKVNINPYVIQDTLSVSMGRDPNLVIERKKVKDETEKPLLSKQVYRTIEIEINVRNPKSVPVTLMLEDQVPVSQHEKIEVEHIDLGDADLNEDSGHMKWKLKLKPGESKKVTFSYKLIYDKDKPLYIK